MSDGAEDTRINESLASTEASLETLADLLHKISAKIYQLPDRFVSERDRREDPSELPLNKRTKRIAERANALIPFAQRILAETA